VWTSDRPAEASDGGRVQRERTCVAFEFCRARRREEKPAEITVAKRAWKITDSTNKKMLTLYLVSAVAGCWAALYFNTFRSTPNVSPAQIAADGGKNIDLPDGRIVEYFVYGCTASNSTGIYFENLVFAVH
jgi:hypothetical protein